MKRQLNKPNSLEVTAMIGWRSFPGVAAVALAASLGSAQAELPNGVKTLEPAGAIKAEGTWSLGARAGDFIFVPANMVHQELNLSDDEPVVAIVARGGDNVVVNVEVPESTADA